MQSNTLSNEWQECTFGELSKESAFGPRFSGKDYADNGNIATLRTTDLDNHGNIDYQGMPLASLEEEKFSQHFLQYNDLVISRSGTCGITAVFKGHPIPVLPGAFLIRFRLHEKANPDFYRYYFNSPVGRANILSVAAGAVQQNINITNVKNLKVPYPRLETQNEIVSFLEVYDNLIENNNRRIAILENMAQSLYREWFVNFRFPGYENCKFVDSPMGKVPEGWEVKPLGEIMSFKKGKKPNETHLINSGNQIQQILIDVLRGASPQYVDPAKMVIANESDSIMVMDGSGSGEVFIGYEGAVGSTLGIFRVNEPEKISPFWLNLFFIERLVEIKSKNVGAAIPHANKEFISRMLIAIHPVKLNDIFHKFSESCFKEILVLRQKNNNLKSQRDMMLPRLVSGSIQLN